MFEKLAQIIAETINVDPADIYPDMRLRGKNGMSDWEFARMLLAVERAFVITVYDIDAAGFQTAGDMLNYIKENKSQKENEDRDDSPIEIEEYFYSE